MPDVPLDLSKINSRAAAAALLGTTEVKLRYLLYVKPVNSRYHTFDIPKRRGGSRQILAPSDDLKRLQSRLARILSGIYRGRRNVHGFMSHRSIVTNASVHKRRRYVFNVDLENFFPSINLGRVRGLLMSAPISMPKDGATVLAQLCCHNGVLPQGAPTSPILSNMICLRLDRQLEELAKKHQCAVTRYADDITFSKRAAGFPREIGYLDDIQNAAVGEHLRQIIEANDFKINPEKVSLYTNKHRQSVTGLIVNAKVNVPRTFIRQIRGLIHAWKKYGEQAAHAEHAAKHYRRNSRTNDVPSLPLLVRGKLEFVKMVRGVGDPIYRRLQTQFAEVYPSYLQVMLEENRKMDLRDVFISHASEDKAVVRLIAEGLVKEGVSVWFDEYEIAIGDSIRQKIDEGLTKSRFGIVVLSKHFFGLKKTWTTHELDGLFALENPEEGKKILPVWNGITAAELRKISPMLVGLRALDCEGKSTVDIVRELKAVIRSPNKSP